jgi:hypothetical protein
MDLGLSSTLRTAPALCLLLGLGRLHQRGTARPQRQARSFWA